MNLADKTILTLAESEGNSLNVDFLPEDFKLLIEDHGVSVLIETAIICPCKTKSSDHRTTCKNCGGGGWIFVNPVSTKMILTSVSTIKNYDPSGSIDLGTMAATPISLIKMSEMDRITVLDGYVESNQVLYTFEDEVSGNYIGRTHYNIEKIIYIGLYEGDDLQLKKLELNIDYVYSNNTIILDAKYSSLTDPQITIRYDHFSQYCVWDIIKNIRSVKTSGEGGRKNNFMPMQAIVKRTHLILDMENVDGNKYFDNSWKIMSCTTDEELTKKEQIIKYTSSEDLFELMTETQRINLKAILIGRLPDADELILAEETVTVTVI